MTVKDLRQVLMHMPPNVPITFLVPTGGDYSGIEFEITDIEEFGKSDTCSHCHSSVAVPGTKVVLKSR